MAADLLVLARSDAGLPLEQRIERAISDCAANLADGEPKSVYAGQLPGQFAKVTLSADGKTLYATSEVADMVHVIDAEEGVVMENVVAFEIAAAMVRCATEGWLWRSGRGRTGC